METYKLNDMDKSNVDVALSLYISTLKKENKKLEETIETNTRCIEKLQETRLKLNGCYYGEKDIKDTIYDENLKGIWEKE